MRTILALDGSVAGSVAVVRDGSIVATRDIPPRGDRAERLMPAVIEALREARVAVRDVDAVVCGSGPGSFTGLRITASIAKGLAFAGGRPLYAVSSLMLMAAAVEPPLPPGAYVATLDALREECFAAVIDVSAGGMLCARGEVHRILVGTREAFAAQFHARLLGDGGKISAVPHARGAARILDGLTKAGPVDLVSWEPDYGRLAEAQVRWELASGRPLGG